MAQAVGLDLGSHAVRAARVRFGTPHQLLAFGQVGLPRGAVEHGEVVEPGTVASAVRRLWREAGIRERRVRVGLASLRTIVRQVEIPRMAEAELRGALEFQAGEFIPLPPEDTHLDYQVISTFETPEGEEMMRVLIAAIHRDTLENALAAVREAGLHPVGVDLIPFALVRALGPRPEEVRAHLDGDGERQAQPQDEGDDGEAPGGEADSDVAPPVNAEVLVSVGAGVTVVVIHEAGVPKFVRIVASGGDDLTEAIAEALDVPFEEAELLKRQFGAGGERDEEIGGILGSPLTELVGEIRGSVDFYLSQAESRPVERVRVIGGGALVNGFLDRLGQALDVPVEVAELLDALEVGDLGFDDDQLERLRPYVVVPVGVALGAEKDALARINLLPAGERRVLSPARVLVGGAGVLAIVVIVLVGITTQRNSELGRVEDDLVTQEAVNRDLQNEIAALSGARELQTEADEARTRLANILGTDVSWSRVLQEIARVIPNDVWLESFGGTVVTTTGDDPTRAPISGSVTFSAFGADFPSVAAWLQRMAMLGSFERPWVSEASQSSFDRRGISVDVVSFSSNAPLAEGARSERSRAARDAAGIAEPGFGPAGGTGATP